MGDVPRNLGLAAAALLLAACEGGPPSAGAQALYDQDDADFIEEQQTGHVVNE